MLILINFLGLETCEGPNQVIPNQVIIADEIGSPRSPSPNLDSGVMTVSRTTSPQPLRQKRGKPPGLKNKGKLYSTYIRKIKCIIKNVLL